MAHEIVFMELADGTKVTLGVIKYDPKSKVGDVIMVPIHATFGQSEQFEIVERTCCVSGRILNGKHHWTEYLTMEVKQLDIYLSKKYVLKARTAKN